MSADNNTTQAAARKASGKKRGKPAAKGAQVPAVQPGTEPGYAARKAATDLLGKIMFKRMPLDGELDLRNGHPGYKRLEPNDRSLVRAILGTALRRRGQIQGVLDALLERPIPEKTGRVLDILHVALAQILFMSIPDHAAVSLAVSLAGRDGRAKPYKGLVNAVLRRATREGSALLEEQSAPGINAPDWMYKRWIEVFGEETAAAIAEAHLLEPYVDFSIKDDVAKWQEQLGGELSCGKSVRLVPEGAIDVLPGFDEGAWWVQDSAAAVPARLLGDVAGLRVADLCAAPGGKTMQLAAAGAHVTAVDVSARRLERLSDNMARMGFEVETVACDLRNYEPDQEFDAILLDAPCSASGTIRRHPDVAWLKREDDVSKLADLQYELLTKAAHWLKPGGLLVYCTCSLEQEEGELQIQRFLLESPEFSRETVDAEAFALPAATVNSQGDFRALPCHNPQKTARLSGMDGFFAARLRKS
ncbi:transcription antitermination factor NusB [Pseudovibrio exalbescens]|uniref:RsmB/NOP family class I SAM-dependent RNA methyltransferase n=1 Tax=Pseudovibrio exalbescens TaxID=197461 RepID=UPI0023666BCF|nr:transcription antitermination factor NusB [Pseudovibrio exalbescens]MDD7909457.1 transcription antitermination factor NusB [Pseudovibrio exalbescens]